MLNTNPQNFLDPRYLSKRRNLNNAIDPKAASPSPSKTQWWLINRNHSPLARTAPRSNARRAFALLGRKKAEARPPHATMRQTGAPSKFICVPLRRRAPRSEFGAWRPFCFAARARSERGIPHGWWRRRARKCCWTACVSPTRPSFAPTRAAQAALLVSYRTLAHDSYASTSQSGRRRRCGTTSMISFNREGWEVLGGATSARPVAPSMRRGRGRANKP